MIFFLSADRPLWTKSGPVACTRGSYDPGLPGPENPSLRSETYNMNPCGQKNFDNKKNIANSEIFRSHRKEMERLYILGWRNTVRGSCAHIQSGRLESRRDRVLFQ